MDMNATALVRALDGSVEEFEAACREASPDMMRQALAILSEPHPLGRAAWAVERAKWGKAWLERILDGRLDCPDR